MQNYKDLPGIVKQWLAVSAVFFLLCGFADVPPLPTPHTNNAVAQVAVNGKNTVFSFMGLTSGKTHRDISKHAFMYTEGADGWRILPDVPVAKGRLASTAVGLRGKVYLFGGYTVAEDGDEVSTPENFVFDPVTETYTRIADMPVPVDDAVNFTYAYRYIYIVSGWHNNDNVRDVQVYDTTKDVWFKATNYPGSPVFGHAGGIVGNRFVISDGVAVFPGISDAPRTFRTVSEGWMGAINVHDPSQITYRLLPQLPGRGHYRMGGAGDRVGNRILFVGGTDNAYNYNGVGYNGVPSKPSAHVFAWDFGKEGWVAYDDKAIASMDHRGLVQINGQWMTIGGMVGAQEVSAAILEAEIKH